MRRYIRRSTAIDFVDGLKCHGMCANWLLIEADQVNDLGITPAEMSV